MYINVHKTIYIYIYIWVCVISRAVNLQPVRVGTPCVAIKSLSLTEYEHGLAQTSRDHMQACPLEFGSPML